MKFNILLMITVSILTSVLQSAPTPSAKDKKEKPPLVVYIAAVGEPPAIGFVQNGASFRKIVQDEEAYPPPNLALKVSMDLAKKDREKSKDKYQKFNLRLNNFTKPYQIKSKTVIIKNGASTLLKLELPRDHGTFAIILSRKPKQKNWECPTSFIIPINPSKQEQLLLNFTAQKIETREIGPIAPLSVKKFSLKKNNVYAKLHTSIDKDVYQSVAVRARPDFVTLVCFTRQRNSSDRLRIITLRLMSKVGDDR